MKSNAALRVVDSNALSSKKMTIQASGKMFHMVISGLYSNKPQSITREIWSNAFDAHAMIGKEDVPFEVTFPTALTPTFSCRDFGPGISHEDMEGFYTVLGHSTKEDTNMAVGKWGVGRMSPMSYTDTFSVVSRHKGMVAYYSVQLAADGSPEVHTLSEPSPTNEPDGLEVSFPVKRFDIPSFQTAAEIVSYGFKVPPRVTNSKDKQFSAVKKVFEGKNFYLYEDSRLSGAYAQMGCVLYPIPDSYLPRRMNVVYKFDIGDLEVTASREALSFGPNDPTAENVKKMAELVESQLFQTLQDNVEAQPKLFDAAKVALASRKYLSHRAPEFKYKGVTLPKHWDLSKYTNIALSCGYKNYRQKLAGWTTDRSLSIADDYTIFVQDLSTKEGSVRAALRIGSSVKDYKHFLWLRADMSNPVQAAEVHTIIDELGYPVVWVKDIPDPGPAGTTKRGKVVVSRILNGRMDKWDMDDARFQQGGYYYPMSNNSYPHVLNVARNFICEALVTDEVVLVPKTLWKRFEANSKWKLVEPELEAAVKRCEKEAQLRFSNNYKTWPVMELVGFKSMNGIVGEFAKKVDEPRADRYMGLERHSWERLLEYYVLPGFNNNEVDKDYKNILDKYPLLSLYRDSKKLHKHFENYINLIDNAAKE